MHLLISVFNVHRPPSLTAEDVSSCLRKSAGFSYRKRVFIQKTRQAPQANGRTTMSTIVGTVSDINRKQASPAAGAAATVLGAAGGRGRPRRSTRPAAMGSRYVPACQCQHNSRVPRVGYMCQQAKSLRWLRQHNLHICVLYTPRTTACAKTQSHLRTPTLSLFPSKLYQPTPTL